MEGILDNTKKMTSETVRLISADGHEFIVDKRAALISGTIRAMLGGPSTISFSNGV
jgi:hypothetical protein